MILLIKLVLFAIILKFVFFTSLVGLAGSAIAKADPHTATFVTVFVNRIYERLQQDAVDNEQQKL